MITDGHARTRHRGIRVYVGLESAKTEADRVALDTPRARPHQGIAQHKMAGEVDPHTDTRVGDCRPWHAGMLTAFPQPSPCVCTHTHAHSALSMCGGEGHSQHNSHQHNDNGSTGMPTIPAKVMLLSKPGRGQADIINQGTRTGEAAVSRCGWAPHFMEGDRSHGAGRHHTV